MSAFSKPAGEILVPVVKTVIWSDLASLSKLAEEIVTLEHSQETEPTISVSDSKNRTTVTA